MKNQKGVGNSLPLSRRRRPLTSQLSLPSKPRKAITQSELTKILMERARPLYEGPQSKGGYHHWGHVAESLAESRPLIQRAIRSGVKLDVDALTHAIIGHDMLFHERADNIGLPSKEHVAADYMYRFLLQSGASEKHARKVVRIILCTHFLAEPKSPEEIIMRATDLSNLAGNYAKFVENTLKLHREAKILNGTTERFEVFARRSLHFLPLYVFRFLHLTPKALSSRGSSAWHEQTLRNTIKLFSEINSGRNNIRVIAQFGTVRSTTTPANQSKNDFVVVVEANEQVREQNLAEWRKKQPKERIPSPAFFVPGSQTRTPLPAQSCDVVEISSKWNIPAVRREIRRILRPRGKVIIT